MSCPSLHAATWMCSCVHIPFAWAPYFVHTCARPICMGHEVRRQCGASSACTQTARVGASASAGGKPWAMCDALWGVCIAIRLACHYCLGGVHRSSAGMPTAFVLVVASLSSRQSTVSHIYQSSDRVNQLFSSLSSHRFAPLGKNLIAHLIYK